MESGRTAPTGLNEHLRNGRWRACAAGVSAGGAAAVDGEGDAEDEAGAGAAEPEDGGGHLAGLAEPRDRLARDGLVHVELAARDHPGEHRGFDRSRADRVDADAARR